MTDQLSLQGGVDMLPGAGKNYPFVLPDPKVLREYIDDLFLATHSEQPLPFSISRIWGGDDSVNVEIIDAVGNVVFTTTGSESTGTYWDPSRYVYQWVNTAGDRLRIVRRLDTGAWPANLQIADGELNQRAVQLQGDRVRIIKVRDHSGQVHWLASDTVLLEAGYNTRLDNDATTLVISVVPGDGAGRFEVCGDESAPLVRRIAGQEVGVGNLLVEADDCFRLQPEVTYSGGEALITPGHFYLHDDCETCCHCRSFAKTLEDDRTLQNSIRLLAGRVTDLKANYTELLEDYQNRISCEIGVTLLMTVVASPDCTLNVVVAVCNNTDENIDPVNVLLSLESAGQAVGQKGPCRPATTYLVNQKTGHASRISSKLPSFVDALGDRQAPSRLIDEEGEWSGTRATGTILNLGCLPPNSNAQGSATLAPAVDTSTVITVKASMLLDDSSHASLTNVPEVVEEVDLTCIDYASACNDDEQSSGGTGGGAGGSSDHLAPLVPQFLTVGNEVRDTFMVTLRFNRPAWTVLAEHIEVTNGRVVSLEATNDPAAWKLLVEPDPLLDETGELTHDITLLYPRNKVRVYSPESTAEDKTVYGDDGEPFWNSEARLLLVYRIEDAPRIATEDANTPLTLDNPERVVRISFGRPVSGFTLDDLVASSNVELSDLQQLSSATYSFRARVVWDGVFVPTPDGPTAYADNYSGTVVLPPDTIKYTIGGDNLRSNQLRLAFEQPSDASLALIPPDNYRILKQPSVFAVNFRADSNRFVLESKIPLKLSSSPGLAAPYIKLYDAATDNEYDSVIFRADAETYDSSRKVYQRTIWSEFNFANTNGMPEFVYLQIDDSDCVDPFGKRCPLVKSPVYHMYARYPVTDLFSVTPLDTVAHSSIVRFRVDARDPANIADRALFLSRLSIRIPGKTDCHVVQRKFWRNNSEIEMEVHIRACAKGSEIGVVLNTSDLLPPLLDSEEHYFPILDPPVSDDLPPDPANSEWFVRHTGGLNRDPLRATHPLAFRVPGYKGPPEYHEPITILKNMDQRNIFVKFRTKEDVALDMLEIRNFQFIRHELTSTELENGEFEYGFVYTIEDKYFNVPNPPQTLSGRPIPVPWVPDLRFLVIHRDVEDNFALNTADFRQSLITKVSIDAPRLAQFSAITDELQDVELNNLVFYDDEIIRSYPDGYPDGWISDDFFHLPAPKLKRLTLRNCSGRHTLDPRQYKLLEHLTITTQPRQPVSASPSTAIPLTLAFQELLGRVTSGELEFINGDFSENLKSLHIANMQITNLAIPANSPLEVLSLRRCGVNTIQDVLYNLTELKKLDLHGTLVGEYQWFDTRLFEAPVLDTTINAANHDPRHHARGLSLGNNTKLRELNLEGLPIEIIDGLYARDITDATATYDLDYTLLGYFGYQTIISDLLLAGCLDNARSIVSSRYARMHYYTFLDVCFNPDNCADQAQACDLSNIVMAPTTAAWGSTLVASAYKQRLFNEEYYRGGYLRIR